MARGEKAPWQISTAVTDIVWDEQGGGITLERTAGPCVPRMTLRPDATAECLECGLPMFPISETSDAVTLECANRHRLATALPTERAARALINNWIAKKGAQLHVQHERWEHEEDEE
jgi:hypothetical protein